MSEQRIKRPYTDAFAYAGVAILLMLPSCRARHNAALTQYNPNEGYRFNVLRPGENNTDDLFVFVAFSGGGTRAAALAYGVLKGLDEVLLPAIDEGAAPRSLLDEVDIISSVSGGTFTAAGYGLWRKNLFDGRFERRFLRRNVQRDLLWYMLNPLNLVKLPLPLVDSIDVASQYYDHRIFERNRFEDLIEQGTRPFIIINATDMARKKTFTFRQVDFDILGSDLSAVPIGWAAAASSAYPILLSPMRLHYHPGEPMRAAVEATLADNQERALPGRKEWAQSLIVENENSTGKSIVIDAKNHKYLYLLDGGLADNLGLHAMIEEFSDGVIRERINDGRIKRLVVIIVDAGTEPDVDLERKLAAPGRLSTGLSSATTSIYINSVLTTGIIEYAFMRAEPSTKAAYDACSRVIDEHCPDAEAPLPPPQSRVGYNVVDIGFRNIVDKKKRHRFLNMITSFALPGKDVAALVEEGRRQATEHPQIRRLVAELNDDAD